MAKIRVYELAHNLEIDIERTMNLLREVGAPPRNHMSVVERVPARRARQLLRQNKNAALPPTQIPQKEAAKIVDTPVARPKPAASAAESPSASKEASSPSNIVQDTEATKAQKAVPSDTAKDVKKQQTSAKTVSPEVKEKQAESSTDRTSQQRRVAKQAEKKTASAPLTKSSVKEKQATKTSMQQKSAKKKADDVTTVEAKTSETAKKQVASTQKQAKEQPKTTAKRKEQRGQKRPEQKASRAKQSRREADATQRKRPQGASRRATGDKKRPETTPRRRPGQRAQGPSGRQSLQPGVGLPGLSSPGPTKRRRRQASKAVEQQQGETKPTGPITIPQSLTVQELADLLHVPATSIIMTLMEVGVMAAINQRIEYDVAATVAEKLGYEVTRPEKKSRSIDDTHDDPEDKLKPRPAVVTIMGHVDHGKTTLLDVIRRSQVAAGEAGGITQHIGAYQIDVDGEKITFLDTPGHEAFTSMRSRGAEVTDIAVLVVAADDGVMPQTLEAISHAKAADVPIIVAINKMDRPGANPDRIKQQLAENDLLPEDWGGDTICVPVSALQHEGIDDLLEMILLVAEIQELKANPDRPAAGVVIDAELDKTRGPVATVLVQTGTLELGNSIVVGSVHGRVRAMFDETGQPVEKAGPSRPVGLLGLSDVPRAGDIVQAVEDDRVARQMSVEQADQEIEMASQRGAGRIRLSEIHAQSSSGEVKDLNLLMKGDVQGSVEALRQSIEKIVSDEVRINMIHTGVGGITESDVALASASNAIIIGFNVRPESTARRAAAQEDVEIRLYRVIYEAIEEIEAAVEGLLDPEYEEKVLGTAEVRALFRVPDIGVVAGCYVTDGKVERNAEARLLRDHVVIYEGRLSSLKRFKDDVREVSSGYECGMSLEAYDDIKEGDIIEVFRMEEIKRRL